MHLPLLSEILMLLSFSVVIVFLLQKLKLPSILGFLLTGILIGPFGLSLVKAVEEVEILAEIGVILLLFVIGMELSIKQLSAIKKTVFIGGFLQVGLTVVVAGAVYYLFGNDINEAVFVGFLFSLSSTAIVLKVFQDRNEINTPQGRNALGILIFQDIIVVPMMLFTPILARQTTNVGLSVVMLLVKTVIVVLITIISARYVVPKLMYAVAKTRSKELFLLTTITICFAVAFLTSEAGLSLALGAFLAGLIISESEYSHQATSIILPFRELFTSFFFISVGMLMDVGFFTEHFAIILLLVLGVLILKTALVSFAIWVLRYSAKVVLITGLSLFQVGEFAFILSKVGITNGLISAETNQYFLSISIVTMLLTPFIMMWAEPLSMLLTNSRLANKLKNSGTNQAEEETPNLEMENHLIIIGFGVTGSNVAKAAMFSNIPFVVIELNAETVERELKNEIPIIYGDASNEHILEAVNLHKARAIVIAIPSAEVTRLIISNIRMISQSVFVMVRTRLVKETEELLALGADDVIPEEFETSVEIFSRILHNFLVPLDEIEAFIEQVRSDNYKLFKSKKKLLKTNKPTQIPEFKVTCVKINRDSGKVVGKSLAEADIRSQFGITVVAIYRKNEMMLNLKASDKLLPQDLVYVHGDTPHIDNFFEAVN